MFKALRGIERPLALAVCSSQDRGAAKPMPLAYRLTEKGLRRQSVLPGVSFVLKDDGAYVPCLHNIKKLGAVCTYGGARWTTFLMGDPPRRFLERSMRLNGAPGARCDYVACYDMDHTTPERRARFLRSVERKFSTW